MRVKVRSNCDWRPVYEAALLENDPGKIRERISAARTAILDTIEDTLTNSSPGNQRAMNDALSNLRTLEHLIVSVSREAA